MNSWAREVDPHSMLRKTNPLLALKFAALKPVQDTGILLSGFKPSRRQVPAHDS